MCTSDGSRSRPSIDMVYLLADDDEEVLWFRARHGRDARSYTTVGMALLEPKDFWPVGLLKARATIEVHLFLSFFFSE